MSFVGFQNSGVFSPLARAVMDRFHEGLILFDPDGHVAFANARGAEVLKGLTGPDGLETKTLLQRLGRLGGRIERLTAGSVVLGHAVYVAHAAGDDTLAEQERRTIVETLRQTGWRLTETANRLGISRTTLWRRLRAYGLNAPDANGDASPEDPDLR